MAKFLVVDDQPDRQFLATLLRHHGHVVLEAADGAEALLAAQAEHPDLIITDVLLPVLDGYELVRELRAVPTLASTKVVFYTAYHLVEAVRPLAAAAGVGRIVAKPAEPQYLLAVVDEALASEAVTPGGPIAKLEEKHLRALKAKLVDKVRELQSAESALRTSEARFRSLAESSPIGIFSLDSAGHVSYSNPRLRQICGLDDMDGMAPLVWAELIHPADRDRVLAGVAAAINAAGRYRDRLRVVRSDSEIRRVVLLLTPIAGDDEHFSHVGTVEDVTEMVEVQRRRQELETRLRSTERLESLGQLAAGIAHDFNNLLGTILSYAQLISADIEFLATSGPGHPRLAQMGEDAAAVGAAAMSAADLTRQLLIFSRREAIHTEVIDANEVVRNAVKLLTRTIGEHVYLESRLDPDLWPIRGDRGRLEQIVVNLVVNARDAISETGTIAITTDNVEVDETTAALHADASSGRYTRVSVIDNGEGMAPETAARAFDPFFTTKPDGAGTGLGLATVHSVVNQLDGYVGVYSEPGTGTTMRVYLPAAPGATKPANLPVEPPPNGHAEAILVVDDDQAVRAVVSRILAGSGYSVSSTGSGAAAIVMLEDPSNRIDLLVTDVVMPDLSGREVAARASDARPGLPVLFMSGYPNDLLSGRARMADGFQVVEKPFTHASLLRSVADALSRQPI